MPCVPNSHARLLPELEIVKFFAFLAFPNVMNQSFSLFLLLLTSPEYSLGIECLYLHIEICISEKTVPQDRGNYGRRFALVLRA